MNILDGSGAGVTTPPQTTGVVVRRVEAVVNAASGSVGAGAAEQLEQIVSRYCVGVRVANAAPHAIASAVRAAVDAKPDLVVILAGDGTAGLAAGLAGPDGPLIAPLPGGTMNMLPHALYGVVKWQDALVAALSQGVVRPVSGGEIGGKAFYVAAILGAPALWANAREAIRARKFRQAWISARIAMSRSFSHRLHFTLGDGMTDMARALTLMCPMVSAGPVEDGALEAAALDPKDVAEVVRLGFNAVTGDWRADPSVTTTLCRAGMAWAKGRIPAILDGEPVRLEHRVNFGFRPVAFRALAPAPLSPLDASLSTPVDLVARTR